MRKIILFTAVLLFVVSTVLPAGAAEKPMPAVILNGLKAYKKSGPKNAIKEWIKGGPMEKRKKDTLQYGASFKEIEKYYGRYLTHQLIIAKNITPVSRYIVISMDFERGPVFARFLAYKGKKGWHLVSFDFNTKPEVIMPSLLLDKN